MDRFGYVLLILVSLRLVTFGRVSIRFVSTRSVRLSLVSVMFG